jgi:hypothetical protein
MKMNPMADVPWLPVEHQTRSGDVDYKLVREGEVAPGFESSSMMIRFNLGDQAFTAPRHRHDFEQIRITLDGDLDFGPNLLCKDGWVSYFPAGAYYGPEKMEGGSLLQVQWGEYWVNREQNRAAVDALRARGEFKNGIYSFVDADGRTKNKDGGAAVWEEVYGRELVIPSPKYPSPILMDPEAFEWSRLDDVLSQKMMGRFTERDLAISKIRWDATGGLSLPDDRTYCVFTLSGSVRDGDSVFGAHTAVWSEHDENDVLIGEAGTEAILLGFPAKSLVSPHPG